MNIDSHFLQSYNDSKQGLAIDRGDYLWLIYDLIQKLKPIQTCRKYFNHTQNQYIFITNMLS